MFQILEAAGDPVHLQVFRNSHLRRRPVYRDGELEENIVNVPQAGAIGVFGLDNRAHLHVLGGKCHPFDSIGIILPKNVILAHLRGHDRPVLQIIGSDLDTGDGFSSRAFGTVELLVITVFLTGFLQDFHPFPFLFDKSETARVDLHAVIHLLIQVQGYGRCVQRIDGHLQFGLGNVAVFLVNLDALGKKRSRSQGHQDSTDNYQKDILFHTYYILVKESINAR